MSTFAQFFSTESTLDMLRIALYQQDIFWHDPEANRQHVWNAFEGTEADVLVVPETFTTGFGDQMAEMAEPPQGPTWHFMLRLAQKHNALTVGTWPVTELNLQGEAVTCNRLHWIVPNGSGGHYDKRHTFRMSNEAEQIAPGTDAVSFEWHGWHIRPAICYDLRFPKWLRNKVIETNDNNPTHLLPGLTQNQTLDYDMLLVCANWPAVRQQTWTTLLQARAIENLAYVAGINRTGVDGNGLSYSGGSALYDFCGRPIASARDNHDEVVTCILDKEALHQFRTRNPIYLDFD